MCTWQRASRYLESHEQPRNDCQQGPLKEAEPLGAQVLETRKRLLGETHPDALTSMANRASLLWNQDAWKEAAKPGKQFTEMKMKILSPDHASTLTSMHNLASTFSIRGRLHEAEELFAMISMVRVGNCADQNRLCLVWSCVLELGMD